MSPRGFFADNYEVDPDETMPDVQRRPVVVAKFPPKLLRTVPLDPKACLELVLSDEWTKRTRPDDSGCIQWIGLLGNSGYGQIRLAGRNASAHRIAWVAAAGKDIPPGLSIDHLCGIRTCVQPKHLEPLTLRANVARAEKSRTTQQSRRTHCPAGHPLDGPQAQLDRSRASRGQRECAVCIRDRRRETYRLTSQAAKALGMTIRAYVRTHGVSQETARNILRDPNDSQIGGHAPHWAASRAWDLAHRNTTEDET